jgi:1,4-alpha-glucan branching enzyme
MDFESRTPGRILSTQPTPSEGQVDPALLIDPHAAQALAEGLAPDPFALLGPHALEAGSGEDILVRTYMPLAEAVEAIDASGSVQAHLSAVQIPDLFCGRIPRSADYRLRIHWPGGLVQETEDPYSFGLLLSELDLYLFAEGKHLELGRCLGAHVMNIGDIPGTRFAVWAPNARRVSVVGDFNGWDGRRHPMRKRVEAGIWELFIPRLSIGVLYKYEIVGPHGLLPLKADPVALEVETPPRTASIITDPAPFHWTDGTWLAARTRQTQRAPLSIYEVHVGSWRRVADEGWRSLRWGELGDQLIPYVGGLGFTHIELMPIMGHPFG